MRKGSDCADCSLLTAGCGVSSKVLIIGGTRAGLRAALDLADAGVEVYWLEKSPFLRTGDGDLRSQALALSTLAHPQIHLWTCAELSCLKGARGAFHAELFRHARYVDLSKCTACGECTAVCPVTVPGTAHRAIYKAGNSAVPSVYAINKLGISPCANTCPGGIHVQGYVALIAQRRFDEALALIRRSIPFPGICGRVCPHPCETNCRRNEVDQAVAIRALKRFVADYELANKEQKVDEFPYLTPSGKKVAVIGSGPAGLTVADILARMGHSVTVFEALPVAGGMLAVGIPSYRLPKEIVRYEVERIQRLGVEIRLNTRIGTDLTLDDLFAQGYAAVFIGIGAHASKNLDIPGENLDGVMHGIQLLKVISLSQQTDDPSWKAELDAYLVRGTETRVAIIGGGNTAMDVARSLRRLGLKDVRVLYRRSRDEMPAIAEEVEQAIEEGIPIDFLVSPVQVLGQDGHVVGLECIRMKLGEPDRSRRRRPVPIAGSEFLLELDLVVPAIGQSPDLSFLGQEHGFAITREGTFNTDPLTYATNRPGVFAAGDAITQPVSVIDAIASAKLAAAGIDAYLRGISVEESLALGPYLPPARQVPVAQRELSLEERAPKPRHPVPTIPMSERTTTFNQVEVGFDEATAVAEAQRCLSCGPCAECLACVEVCKPGAIDHRMSGQLVKLDVQAVIVAEEALAEPALAALGLDAKEELALETSRPGLYWAGNDPLRASAAAALAMRDAQIMVKAPLLEVRRPTAGLLQRIGVFLCQCNGQMEKAMDQAAIAAHIRNWPSVAYVDQLPMACISEAWARLHEAVGRDGLDGIVLAACSCCASDQICASCTWQRIRCKTGLGFFHSADGLGVPLELLNIREQCAWLYGGDREATTRAAQAMVAAAVARLRSSVPVALPYQAAGEGAVAFAGRPSVLVAGELEPRATWLGLLAQQGVDVYIRHALPVHISGSLGNFTVREADGGDSLRVGAVVLAPADSAQASLPFATLAGPYLGSAEEWPDTRLPGVFVLPPGVDQEEAGLAIAARLIASLARPHRVDAVAIPTVDTTCCRACRTCETVCPFGAVAVLPVTCSLLPAGSERMAAQVNMALCRGCGICVAHCPNGALTLPYGSDAQWAASLEALFRKSI